MISRSNVPQELQEHLNGSRNNHILTIAMCFCNGEDLCNGAEFCLNNRTEPCIDECLKNGTNTCNGSDYLADISTMMILVPASLVLFVSYFSTL